MATIKVRQNGPYLVEGDDVTLVDWNGNALSDCEAAVRAVPLRRVDEQAVLRRHALEDRVSPRPKPPCRERGQARTIAQSTGVGTSWPVTGADYAMPRLDCHRPHPALYLIDLSRDSVSRDVHVAILRVFEMSASGSASSTTKSAHLAGLERAEVRCPPSCSARRRASPLEHLLRRQARLRHQLELHQLEVALEAAGRTRCRCPSRSSRRRRRASSGCGWRPRAPPCSAAPVGSFAVFAWNAGSFRWLIHCGSEYFRNSGSEKNAGVDS